MGKITGGVIGGAVGILGEVTGSKFISEVGKGIYTSSTYMGKQLGNATQGVWDIGEGLIKKDEDKIHEGLNNIGEGVTNTGTAVFGTIKHVATSARDVGGGLLDEDSTRWKKGVRELGKTAAIGVLGVSILDVADVVDVNGNEGEHIQKSNLSLTSEPYQTIEVPNAHFVEVHSEIAVEHIENSNLTEASDSYETFENPNTHHVDAHYVEGHMRNGSWIEGYWRDGDGDTNVDTNDGYEASNPDFRSKI